MYIQCCISNVEFCIKTSPFLIVVQYICFVFCSSSLRDLDAIKCSRFQSLCACKPLGSLLLHIPLLGLFWFSILYLHLFVFVFFASAFFTSLQTTGHTLTSSTVLVLLWFSIFYLHLFVFVFYFAFAFLACMFCNQLGSLFLCISLFWKVFSISFYVSATRIICSPIL